MRTIEFHKKPRPYFLMDEFLNPRLHKELFNEVKELEEHFKISKTKQITDDPIKEFMFTNSELSRRNIDLDELYGPNRDKSLLIMSLMKEVMVLRQRFMKEDYLFRIFDHVNSVETLLSRYGACDFYGWHKDNSHPSYRGRRILTLVYWFNTEPKRFTGGELMFGGNTIDPYTVVEPKNNRAILFESHSVHAVSNVHLSGDKFMDGRFSINMWFGITENPLYSLDVLLKK